MWLPRCGLGRVCEFYAKEEEEKPLELGLYGWRELSLRGT